MNEMKGYFGLRANYVAQIAKCKIPNQRTKHKRDSFFNLRRIEFKLSDSSFIIWTKYPKKTHHLFIQQKLILGLCKASFLSNKEALLCAFSAILNATTASLAKTNSDLYVSKSK